MLASLEGIGATPHETHAWWCTLNEELWDLVFAALSG